MDPKLILDILAIGISIVSALVAAVACYFSFRSNTPKIKINLDPNAAKFSSSHKYLALSLILRNESAMAGTISKIWTNFNSQIYYSHRQNEDLNISGLNIVGSGNGNAMDINERVFFTPITVEPFSYTNKVIIFSGLAPTTTSIELEINFEIVGKRRNKKIKIIVSKADLQNTTNNMNVVTESAPSNISA